MLTPKMLKTRMLPNTNMQTEYKSASFLLLKESRWESYSRRAVTKLLHQYLKRLCAGVTSDQGLMWWCEARNIMGTWRGLGAFEWVCDTLTGQRHGRANLLGCWGTGTARCHLVQEVFDDLRSCSHKASRYRGRNAINDLRSEGTIHLTSAADKL